MSVQFDRSRKFATEADAKAACPEGWSVAKSTRGDTWHCVPPPREAQKSALPELVFEAIRSDILTATLTPPDYLWAPRIPRDGVTLLIGEDGLGKSYLALMLCLHAAAGRPLFGVPLKCGKAKYVHAEDRKPMIERRVQTILRSWNDPVAAALALQNFRHHDTVHTQLQLLDCSTREVLFTPWVEALRTQIGEAALTVFDPAARLHNGPENDSTLATRLVTAGERIALGTKGAILIPHHPTKQGTREHITDGTETRGSGALRAAARSQLRLIAAIPKDIPGVTNVTPDDFQRQNVLILFHSKLSDGAKAAPVILKRAETNGGLLETFRVEHGDPLQGLLAWFKEQGGKPFTTTRARNQRGHWGTLSERDAEIFIRKQVESGALISSGTVKGNVAYVPSPATVQRIAELDAANQLIVTGDWLDV